MEKEFIPYEQAVELKELGFDEPCFGYYSNGNLVYGNHTNNMMQRFRYSAPTFSQAFRWFREKYGLHQHIKQYCGEKFYFIIEDMVHPRRSDEYTVEMLRTFNESNTQEEAELACLVKLIEIVKNSK